MAEKDADDNTYSFENENKSNADQALPEENVSCEPLLESKNKKDENESLELDSYLSSYESPFKKEENPFSFKKFLNQDSSAQKNKGARKKVFPTTSIPPSSTSDSPNQSSNKSSLDLNSRMVNATDMSSVLPDFVQDHLVIEQCYLSGGSPAINIDNLNLQNLPDLNLEHRNVHFMINSDENHSNQSLSNQFSSNLPDFTLGARNFQSVSQNSSCGKRLPDFALSARTDTNNDNVSFNERRRKGDINNGNDASQSSRQRSQISLSPSVPLDLPSYESNESIPFDLTIPAEDKSNCVLGRTSGETVSKSLPDFLSDGPIKKELDENLQSCRGGANVLQNGLPPPEVSSARSDADRLSREIEYLRRQLLEKSRQVERLELELERLHSTDQRETASLEYALQEVENNLKQTAKRALNAENMVLKLKHENKLLKSEICSLRSKNVELKLGSYELQSPQSLEIKNQKIAKELKIAANKAENSLRSLLSEVDNLRVLAASMEAPHQFQSSSKEYPNFSQDSASGPAL